MIFAGSGTTTVTGGTGNDSITGGTGNDVIFAGNGTTTVTGGGGNDSITGGTGNDVIFGGNGTTTVTGGSGNDSITGGTGNDVIFGGNGNTTITGGGGNDTITGGTGNDVIFGGSAPTTLTGGTGNDSITGGTGNDVIFAGNGNSTVTGGTGNDSITGGTGNDVIFGGNGNTTITGGGGNDTITGGTGNDVIFGGNAPTTLTGGNGNDSITGGTGNDVIFAGNGNSTVTGGTGNDSITGGTGNDVIFGGSGNTTITGGGGSDTITGGTGNDVIFGGNAPTTVTGGGGNDSITGGTGNDVIFAGNGNSTVTGGSGNDSITGGTGNDVIFGGSGNTTITGGGGNDSITGGTGNDVIFGGSAPTTLTGGTGNDSITGGTGNDVIYTGNGDNTVYGGSGNDTIVGGTGDNTITGGAGNDYIVGGTGSDSITGGDGSDIIFGGLESGTIIGGSGNDTLFGGNGNDTIYGGTGNATIVGGARDDSIVGGAGNDIIYSGTLSSTIYGGTGDDLIFGDEGNDIIDGGSGNDTIIGITGNDSILGGSGNDIIYGGTGQNTIVGGTGNSTISGGGGNDSLVGGGFDSWIMGYASADMTLTGTTLTLAPEGSPESVSTISGFQNAILAAGTGNFTLDASQFTGTTILQGGTGNDTLIGSSSSDTLIAGTGDDSLVGGGGNDTFTFSGSSSGSDTIDEADGNNIATLDFSNAPDGITIDLSQTGPQTVIPGVLTLTLSNPMGISNVLGSPYDDTIIGNARDNTLIGAGGDDLIAGLGGNDVIEGGITRTVFLDFTTDTTPGDHVYTSEEQTDILDQLEADYAEFPYTFTLTQPGSGPYTTIFFNDPALTGLEGGSATSIDWRDLDIAGSTTLSALTFVNGYPTGGLQVEAPDSAGVNVANLLGAAGEPPANSADFVALSSTIAAHELGHLSGEEHGDSFGPIGSGIYAGVDPGLFNPPYPGPTGADETTEHIMASGASVGETLFQAISSPFFGEREAIVLAYGEDGSPVNEQTAPHYSMAAAQPVALQPLVVPDTDLEGVNADQVFDVTAADVVGYLGLNSSGTSQTDFYSFTAQAGTLINIQVLSAVLDNPQGAFDTTLTVYDASGNEIAYNDDSFQDTDSSILDLTLPESGTYYVEVTAADKPGEPTDQTGAYELFMYTFATNGDPPAGDTMYAGSGDDTLIAGTGDDTIESQPNNVVIPGSGTPTFLSKAPYLDMTVTAPTQPVNEGQSVTLTSSFIDPDDADTHTYDWHVVASSGQEIPDGTGPSFTFVPGNAGTYCVTFTVSDHTGPQPPVTVEFTSLAVPPVLTPPTTAQQAVAGISSTFNLGSLTVAGVGPWTATVNWGDGQMSTFSPTGSGTLSDAHTYETGGQFTISESVAEYDGDTTSVTFPQTVNVMDQPVVVTGVPVSANLDTPTGSVVVATFTDPDGPGPVANYSASITWGDGQTSTGTITYNSTNEMFSVSGSHTYSTVGTETIMVTVSHGNAPPATSSSTATVAPAVTTTTLSSSSATAVYGSTVTFTAVVSSPAIPTGTVTFYAGAINSADALGTGTLGSVSGHYEAMLSTHGLSVSGSPYAIWAVYGGDADDQKSTSSSVSQTITPAALIITANNQSKVYGAALPTLTVSYAGFVNGDSSSSLSTQPTVSTTATSKSAVGSYTITAKGAVDPNYSISYVAGTLSVTPAALTITANNQSKVYGQVNPTLTVSYSGFVNGDSSSSLTTQPTVSTTATTSSPVGTYPITASGAVDPNYTISYVAGTLTINKDASTTSVSASTSSGSFGVAITFTATVTANAPGSGTPTGSVTFSDTTTSDTLGTVTLSGGVATLVMSSLPPGSQTIDASYSGDSNFLASSESTRTITINPSIIVLDPKSSGALSLAGNASISVSGVVYVDSSSSSAISASGNASVNASAIDVHGGVQKSGNATFKPTPTTGVATLADPLAGLTLPSTSGVTNYGSENLSGNSKATIKPGIYSQIAVSGNAGLTMSSGVYIIEGGGFSVSGNATVSGSGVMIFNAGSNYPSSGGTFRRDFFERQRSDQPEPGHHRLVCRRADLPAGGEHADADL